jgi:hypothetical protein
MAESVLPSLVGRFAEHRDTGERRRIEDVLLVPGTARVAYMTLTEDGRLELWDEAEATVIRDAGSPAGGSFPRPCSAVFRTRRSGAPRSRPADRARSRRSGAPLRRHQRDVRGLH